MSLKLYRCSQQTSKPGGKRWQSSRLWAALALLIGLLASSVVMAGAQTPVQQPTSPWFTPAVEASNTEAITPTLSAPSVSPTPLVATRSGFVLIDSAPGVDLFRKDYPGGNPDFVQKIDLSNGARLVLMHGDITEPRPTKGSFGGPDPRMNSLPLQTYWDQARQLADEAFCATNGQFFYMPEYPTRLAFPLKVDNRIVSEGWGIATYVDQQLLLELWSDHADIIPLTEQNLVGSEAPDVIGGLTEAANKRAKYSVGRTFIGLADEDDDGIEETVLIFNSLTAKQSWAADILRNFGADRIMMLDGGGSTQLICRSGWWIRSDRPVPQAIAVIAAVPPPVSSQIISYNNWPVVVEGDRLPLEIRIQNTGVVSWNPGTTVFHLQTERLELQESTPAVHITIPGEATTISQSVPLFKPKDGNPIKVDLSISYRDSTFPAGDLEIQPIEIPSRLRSQQSELEEKVRQWAAENPEQVVELAKAWVAEQITQPLPQMELTGVDEIQPMDVTFIPLLMLPAMALIAWAIARTRH